MLLTILNDIHVVSIDELNYLPPRFLNTTVTRDRILARNAKQTRLLGAPKPAGRPPQTPSRISEVRTLEKEKGRRNREERGGIGDGKKREREK